MRLSAKDRAKRLGFASTQNQPRERSRSREAHSPPPEQSQSKELDKRDASLAQQAYIQAALGFEPAEDAKTPGGAVQDEEEMALDPSEDLDHNKKTLEELYTDLIEYKNNLFKIETLMALERDDSELEIFAQMKTSLKQAIAYQVDAIKLAQGEYELTFNGELLKPEYTDRLCSAWHPRDRRWYFCKIAHVDLDKQEAKIEWIGYPETDKLKAMFVKVMPVPDPAKFQPATICECICPDDGKWQGAIIERIVDKGFAVKFRKSGVKHVGFF